MLNFMQRRPIRSVGGALAALAAAVLGTHVLPERWQSFLASTSPPVVMAAFGILSLGALFRFIFIETKVNDNGRLAQKLLATVLFRWAGFIDRDWAREAMRQLIMKWQNTKNRVSEKSKKPPGASGASRAQKTSPAGEQ